MRSLKGFVLGLAAVGCLLMGTASAKAAVIRLGPGSFTPQASVITFSEQALGTQNPVYNNIATQDLGLVNVTFGPRFVGQSYTGGFPESLTGSPTGPLTLSATAGDVGHETFITNDGANPTSPVLSGTPTFNGPISVLFSVDVAAVGLDGGFFNANNSTTIEAFDRQGNSLGSVTNNGLGIEFFGLLDANGQNTIAGISFYITGPEPAGFAIDNLTFGAASVVGGVVPVPASAVLMGLGGIGCLGARLRRKTA